jgi:hypothetical protein
MKLIMTLLVRNEAETIRANLEYHLAQGVDFVIVTDHGSQDGTSEILREYERIGVAKVIRDEEEGHHQSNRVTRMAEIARLGHGASWVIHNDADEFWWPLVGNLRDVFSSLPARFGQIEVRRRNFRPLPDVEGSFHSRLIYREANSLNLLGHTLEPKVAHRAHPDVVVAPGNHSIRGAHMPAVPVGEVLEIFHFPMRTYEQFERKVLQIGHGYEQLHDRSPLVGQEQLGLLALHRAGELRAYYDGLVLDREALERGLRIGTLVVDRRLRDFMRELNSGDRSAIRPDAPFAGTVLRRLMAGLEDAEERREQLETLHTDASEARQHAELSEARVTDLIRDLRRSEDELDAANASPPAVEQDDARHRRPAPSLLSRSRKGLAPASVRSKA